MNILIVESENDQYFIESLAKKVSFENTVCRIDTFKHSSLDAKLLTTQIASVLGNIDRGLSKIGIILDMDNSTQNERILLINKCLKQALIDCGYVAPSILLSTINEFIDISIDESLNIKVACFFTNVDGEGELETVLKAIKSDKYPSIFADCLYEGWQNCLKEKGIKIVSRGEQGDFTDKELLKLWVDFYKRFDTLKKKERNEKNTDWRGIMTGVTKPPKEETLNSVRGDDIFNLESEILKDIRFFLRLFD